MFKYSDKHRKFIENNYKGITTTELAKLFNNKFGENITRNQIKCYLGNHKLSNGIINRFEKGHIPANKGTKGMSKANKASFQKGNIPQNYRSIGSERITKDGYIEIKIMNPNKWELKHRLVYKKSFGEIPKNHAIFFLDQDKLNVNLENLVLISRQELLILNNEIKLSNDIDINKTKILIAKIKARYSKLSKNK